MWVVLTCILVSCSSAATGSWFFQRQHAPPHVHYQHVPASLMREGRGNAVVNINRFAPCRDSQVNCRPCSSRRSATAGFWSAYSRRIATRRCVAHTQLRPRPVLPPGAPVAAAGLSQSPPRRQKPPRAGLGQLPQCLTRTPHGSLPTDNPAAAVRAELGPHVLCNTPRVCDQGRHVCGDAHTDGAPHGWHASPGCAYFCKTKILRPGRSFCWASCMQGGPPPPPRSTASTASYKTHMACWGAWNMA